MATLITITASYPGATLGLVELMCNAEMQDSTDLQMYPPVVYTAPIDPITGAMSVEVPANTDPTTQPTGSSYRVIERIEGAAPRAYNVVVPHDVPDATVDLSVLAPVSPTGLPVYAYLLLPVGATEGDVPVFDGTTWVATPSDSAAIATEVSAREAGDATNSVAIFSEASRAEAAETGIAASVTAEASTRAGAVTALTSAASSEATTRAAGDAANATAVTNETSRATTAESGLSSQITAEMTARAAAVTAAISTAETYTVGAVTTETSRAETIEAEKLQLLGSWQTAQTYLVNQSVLSLGAWWSCLEQHVSGSSFVADALAGKWVQVSSVGVRVVDATSNTWGYDCDPTGTADSAAPLTSLIAACILTALPSGPTIIYFPPGNYIFDSVVYANYTAITVPQVFPSLIGHHTVPGSDDYDGTGAPLGAVVFGPGPSWSGDYNRTITASITAGSPHLTISGGTFSTGAIGDNTDLGSWVSLLNGSAVEQNIPQGTRIISMISSTEAEMSANATATLSGQTVAMYACEPLLDIWGNPGTSGGAASGFLCGFDVRGITFNCEGKCVPLRVSSVQDMTGDALVVYGAGGINPQTGQGYGPDAGNISSCSSTGAISEVNPGGVQNWNNRWRRINILGSECDGLVVLPGDGSKSSVDDSIYIHGCARYGIVTDDRVTVGDVFSSGNGWGAYVLGSTVGKYRTKQNVYNELVVGPTAEHYPTLIEEFNLEGTSSGGSVLTDGVFSTASKTITSASAGFTAYSVGSYVYGPGLSAGTKITAYNSATSVTLNNFPTITGSGNSFVVSVCSEETGAAVVIKANCVQRVHLVNGVIVAHTGTTDAIYAEPDLSGAIVADDVSLDLTNAGLLNGSVLVTPINANLASGGNAIGSNIFLGLLPGMVDGVVTSQLAIGAGQLTNLVGEAMIDAVAPSGGNSGDVQVWNNGVWVNQSGTWSMIAARPLWPTAFNSASLFCSVGTVVSYQGQIYVCILGIINNPITAPPLDPTHWSRLVTDSLTPTAVQTANYDANPGDFVPCNNTTGSLTVTLPTTPADKSQVAVKITTESGSNTVTIAAGGSDVIDKAGTTSLVLQLQGEATILQYSTVLGGWYIIEHGYALAALATYIASEAGAVTGVFGRTGAVVAEASDYAAFYNPVPSITAESSGFSAVYGDTYVPSAAVTATLPAPTAGQQPITFAYGGHVVTIAPHGSEVLNFPSVLSKAGQSVTVFSDGTNWYPLSQAGDFSTLAVAQYDPATNDTYVSTGSLAAILWTTAGTNLTASFYAPLSGQVQVDLWLLVKEATASDNLWATLVTHGGAVQVSGCSAETCEYSTYYSRTPFRFIVPGLTPGTSYSWDAAVEDDGTHHCTIAAQNKLAGTGVGAPAEIVVRAA